MNQSLQVRPIPHAVLFGCLFVGSGRGEELLRAAPRDVGLSADKLDKVTAAVQTAVDKNRTAGVVVLVARRGKVAYLESSPSAARRIGGILLWLGSPASPFKTGGTVQ